MVEHKPSKKQTKKNVSLKYVRMNPKQRNMFTKLSKDVENNSFKKQTKKNEPQTK